MGVLKFKKEFLLYVSVETKDYLVSTAKTKQELLKKMVSVSDIVNQAIEYYYENKLSINDSFRYEMSRKGEQAHKITIKVCLNKELMKLVKNEANGYCRVSHIIEYAIIQYSKKERR
jgi:hypothetical protein